MFKDLSSTAYWAKFGEMGANVGRANMPTPQEAAATVIALKSEVAAMKAERDDLSCRLSRVIGEIEGVSADFATRLDNLRHEVRGMR